MAGWLLLQRRSRSTSSLSVNLCMYESVSGWFWFLVSLKAREERERALSPFLHQMVGGIGIYKTMVIFCCGRWIFYVDGRDWVGTH